MKRREPFGTCRAEAEAGCEVMVLKVDVQPTGCLMLAAARGTMMGCERQTAAQTWQTCRRGCRAGASRRAAKQGAGSWHPARWLPAWAAGRNSAVAAEQGHRGREGRGSEQKGGSARDGECCGRLREEADAQRGPGGGRRGAGGFPGEGQCKPTVAIRICIHVFTF